MSTAHDGTADQPPTLAELIEALDGWYPPATAESWDRVGLSCGDPGDRVHRVLLAVDCVPATVAEAIDEGAGLLLTHHPLLLSGVHSVAADTGKGALLHRMIRAGVAHFAAHTNADVATDGVSTALADRLALAHCRPLQADAAPALDHLAVFVPPADAERLLAALAEAGAGAIGNYTECAFTVEGIGRFRPQPGAQPAAGRIGELYRAGELRVSVVLPRSARDRVLAAMHSAHPYEEVAFELTEQPRLPSSTGTGRVGQLPAPMPLAAFAEYVLQRLPRTRWGIRVAGRAEQVISRVAVCGGSGAAYTEDARRAGADAYLTSDLKHHSTLESVAELAGLAPELALLDAAHWATEAPWLHVAAGKLRRRFGALQVLVSEQVTDPWTLHVR
ncbi:MAG TPA: Nif3-like dinuclear metal center hexameric protein [Jatrophihabitans sp.]|nr:Nif3-like dinuclear metal center hexameric protein [Jatrophihabitans sp.]